MTIVRPTILALLALVGVAVLLFGSRASENPPEGRVVIEYWEKWSGPEGQRMADLVEEFNQTIGKEKNIYVRFLSISNVDKKTLLASAAGNPPDVAGLWDRQLAQYAAMNAIEPLDDLAAQHGISAAMYKPGYAQGVQYEGKLYGLISAGWVVGLHYNRHAFEEAGLDPDRPPQTIGELDAMAMKLDRWNGTSLKRAGFLPTVPGWYVDQVPIWFGGRLFDPQTRKFTLLEPNTIAAFEWIESYSKRLAPETIQRFSSPTEGADSARDPFIVGDVVMEQQGPWVANYIRRYRPDDASPQERPPDANPDIRNIHDWGAAAFPSADGRIKDAAYVGFDVLVIPRGSKHKREAFELLAFLSGQICVERLAKSHGKNSPLKNVSEDFLNNHPNPQIKVFERLAASPNARPAPSIPTWPQATVDLNAMVQSIVSGEKPAKQALIETQERLQQTYDRFMEIQRQRAESQR